MKRFLLFVPIFFLLSSHDLFLKTNSYFMKANTDSELFLFNGTFDKSENAITRDRIIDASVYGPSLSFSASDGDWYDQDKSSFMKFKTGESGTYVGGVSTKARMIEMSAKDFNGYLSHDGVLDVLEARKKSGEDKNPAKESYAKHVKVLFQVGDGYSDHYNKVLGYPVEFVALENPYKKKPGDEITFQLLKNKEPLGNHLVYVGHRARDEAPTHEHVHNEAKSMTNEKGEVTFKIDHDGIWYLRMINMVKGEGDVDYVSNWTTISFEVK